MEVEANIVRRARQQRGWTQQQLAEIADLSLRTIQRVENQGLASNESVSALCAVLELERKALLRPPRENRGFPTSGDHVRLWLVMAAAAGAGVGATLTWLAIGLGGGS